MNEITNINNIFSKLYNFSRNNLKVISLFFASIAIVFFFIQVFSYIQYKKTLNASFLYENTISNKSDKNFETLLSNLSKENNFYGTLAALEKIKLNLDNNKIDLAYQEYLSLLNDKKIDNLYKSLIAIQASYRFMDQINIEELQKNNSLFSSSEIFTKINNLLFFIDDSIISFEGHKLEINFLLLIIEHIYNKEKILSNKSEELYKKIQSSDNVVSSIKERVKKIYDFQIYK
jgi:predicted negative regulator of RcsB-dependent stress response